MPSSNLDLPVLSRITYQAAKDKALLHRLLQLQQPDLDLHYILTFQSRFVYTLKSSIHWKLAVFSVTIWQPFKHNFTLQATKVNGNIFKGSIFAIFISVIIISVGQLFQETALSFPFKVNFLWFCLENQTLNLQVLSLWQNCRKSWWCINSPKPCFQFFFKGRQLPVC